VVGDNPILIGKSRDFKRVRLRHHDAATSNKYLNSNQSNQYDNQLLKSVKTKSIFFFEIYRGIFKVITFRGHNFTISISGFYLFADIPPFQDD
jgi:hypothetical protein